MRFMTMARRNRIRAILTPRGLASALAWSGGISNSSVQLVDVNYEHIAAVVHLLQPLKAKLEPYFTRCNDVLFHASTGPPLRNVDDIRTAARELRQFKMTVFPYSGIQGADICATLGLKEEAIHPTLCVQQGDLEAFDATDGREPRSADDASSLTDTPQSDAPVAGVQDFAFVATPNALVSMDTEHQNGDNNSDDDEQ